MYGKNKALHQNPDDKGLELQVYETFASIQGEGPYAGEPAIFIRLSGCLLQCYMCDTDFESSIDSTWPLNVFLQRVKELNTIVDTDLVVITGGEPLRQNIVPLIDLLVKNGYRVQIETAGSKFFNRNWNYVNHEWLIPYRKGINKQVTFVCSPKTALIDERLRQYIDAWKYVIRKDEVASLDGLPNYSTQINSLQCTTHCIIARPGTSTAPIYVQPMDEEERDNKKFTAEIAMKYGYKLSIQIHKTIGLP